MPLHRPGGIAGHMYCLHLLTYKLIFCWWWKSTFTPFKLGDQVWLDTRNLKTNHHKKIGPKREGPFKIIKVIGPVTYQLDLPKTWKIHNVFHTTLLWQYKETEVYGANFPKPPPELIEGEEVENILKHRRTGGNHFND